MPSRFGDITYTLNDDDEEEEKESDAGDAGKGRDRNASRRGGDEMDESDLRNQSTAILPTRTRLGAQREHESNQRIQAEHELKAS